SKYELDGLDVMPMVADGDASPHEEIFWEMNQQTAVRRGKWKLTLNGRLVEGAPEEDDVHLADLDVDMGEKRNLKDEYPEVAAELKAAAETWRNALEDRWEREWVPHANGTTGHVKRS
ncbi:sulfatase, partial [candidate division KSB1 bacterium]|nr:sulfatase [candidate division KSB1 bacterium]